MLYFNSKIQGIECIPSIYFTSVVYKLVKDIPTFLVEKVHGGIIEVGMHRIVRPVFQNVKDLNFK